MFEVPISIFFFFGGGGAFFSNTLDLHGLGVRRSAIVIIISWCPVLKKIFVLLEEISYFTDAWVYYCHPRKK